MNLNKEFINEHGAVWIMAALRVPPVHEHEVHYLDNVVDPSYLEIGCDSDLLAQEPPETVNVNDYMSNTGHASDIGKAPYAQWLRYHPNTVHSDFDSLNGFLWYDATLSTAAKARYVTPSDRDWET